MTVSRRFVTWLLFVVAAACLAGLPTTARADVSNLELEWTAPAGCLSREQVKERIARLVGEGKHARESIAARVIVGIRGSTLRADVVLSGAGEQSARVVDGDTCSAVTDAAVLIVALAIDPEASAPPPAPPVIALPFAEAPPPPVETAPRPLATPARRALFVGIGPRLDFGALPASALGGDVVAGLEVAHLVLELHAALLASARASLAANANEGADVGLVEAGGRACYALLDGTLALGPCAGLDARWLPAQGYGAETNRDATALFGLGSVGALGKVRLSPRLALRSQSMLRYRSRDRPSTSKPPGRCSGHWRSPPVQRSASSCTFNANR